MDGFLIILGGIGAVALVFCDMAEYKERQEVAGKPVTYTLLYEERV